MVKARGGALAQRDGEASTGSREALDRLVAKISHITRTAGLSLSREVGALVVAEIFRGDLKALHDRGTKDETYRQLARHPKLPFSASTLWRAVKVYELGERMPKVLKSEHLTVNHLCAVHGLRGDVQERLLHAADKERWTTGQLEQKAAAHRPEQERRSGRLPASPMVRSLSKAKRFACASPREDEINFLNQCTDRQVAALRDDVRAFRAWLEAFESAIDRRSSTIQSRADT